MKNLYSRLEFIVLGKLSTTALVRSALKISDCRSYKALHSRAGCLCIADSLPLIVCGMSLPQPNRPSRNDSCDG